MQRIKEITNESKKLFKFKYITKKIVIILKRLSKQNKRDSFKYKLKKNRGKKHKNHSF